MTISRKILATYRRPRQVIRSILGEGLREDRAIAYLMFACGLIFVAQTPRLAREAHLNESDFNMQMGATLMAWIIIAPLIFYAIAAIARLIGRLIGGRGSMFGARIALFWALLAASPLILLHGLTAGFVGEGLELNLVGAIWLLCFLWFWLAGSLEQERGE